MADLLASSLACTTAAVLVYYSMYVPQRPVTTTSPRWDFHMFCACACTGRRCLCREWHGDLLIVHHHWQLSSICACSRSKVPIAPMGFSHVCARLCLQGGGVLVHSGTVTFSSCTITGNTATGVRAHAQNFPSPLPIAPMGILLTRLPRLLLYSTPVNYSRYVPPRPRKFPSPRWDFHMFCACACRAAVPSSVVARSPSHRAALLATELLCVLMFESSHRPDGNSC